MSARRTNEHEKTRSKGSENVSFIETQKKKEEIKYEDERSGRDRQDYLQASMGIDGQNYRITRRKSETPAYKNVQTSECKREKSHTPKDDKTDSANHRFKDEKHKENHECFADKKSYRKEDQTKDSKNSNRSFKSKSSSSNMDPETSSSSFLHANSHPILQHTYNN